MENKVILSIVIPVYNGEKYVGEAIHSVVSQMAEFKNEVEFLVRDNCSTDRTGEVVRKYQDDYPGFIQYNRRRENVSADNNFIESIHLAQGKYVVLLGDDDLLFPSFIYEALKNIKRYPQVGLIYFNRLSTSINYVGFEAKHKDPNPKLYRYYNYGHEFIKTHISGPDFISVNVFRKDCFVKAEPLIESKYYGYLIYFAMLKGVINEPCLYVCQPCVLQRHPLVRGWFNNALLYIKCGLPNIFSELDKVSPGIMNEWKKYEKSIHTFDLLFPITNNKKLYRDKWPEIKNHLSPIEKIYYKLLLNTFFGKYIYKITYVNIILFRKFKSAINKIKK